MNTAVYELERHQRDERGPEKGGRASDVGNRARAPELRMAKWQRCRRG